MPNPPAVDVDCFVKPESDLVLDIIIGNAQIGGSAIWKDQTLLKTGEFTRHPLGKGAEWIGHTLFLKTVVADVNSATNKMVVTDRVHGGSMPVEIRINHEVSKAGDSATFFGGVIFKKA